MVATEGRGPGVELVALLASAGGLEALSTVLRDLPVGFPAAVVVQQHLGGHNSVLTTILRRQTGHSVGWAQDGRTLTPGEVTVCPPGMLLELAPDGRCRLHAGPQHGAQGSDVLLTSVARSYGPRSVAVVLSGSGHDGAAGTVAMKRAGAVVIAESPDTAQYPSMPAAAARAGADLVLPVGEIAAVLAALAGGEPLPAARDRRPPPPQEPPDDDPDAAAGTPDLFAPPAPGPATNSAADRSELARLRAAELARRRADLSNGFGATRETVALARRRAAESRRRAQLAQQAAEEASARREHGRPGTARG